MGRKEISAEELLGQARAKGYEQGAHREIDSTRDTTKYVKKTLKDQDWALGRYKKWVEAITIGKQERSPIYESEVVVPELPRLENNSPSSDLATIKDFLRFHVAISRGRIDEEGRITADSVNTFAEWFFAGWARVTGNTIDKESRKAVYDWTRNVLVDEGLVANKKKPKQLFGKNELTQFNITFWTTDDTQFVHPRNKAQIPFTIAVFCWTGVRIGAFFPDTDNKAQGGLRYRDVEVVLQRESGSGWKIIYRIDQCWVKNNRDLENTLYGASTSQYTKFLYNDTQYLLALAFADKAFYGISSPEDLWQIVIPHDENEMILRWNDSVKHLPVLRNATMKHGVTEEPLPKRTFDRIIKSVLSLSGYFGNITIHAIRRFIGKKINERYTEFERSQHLTQTDTRVYGQSYVANTSSVSGRDAFPGEPAMHDHVNFFQSFSKFREKGLPTCLPAEQENAIEQDPYLKEMTARIHLLKSNDAPLSEIQDAKNKASSYRRKETAKCLKKHQLEWIQDQRDWKITSHGKEWPDDNIKTDLLEVLSRIMPERGRLTKTMISTVTASNEERRQVVSDLYSLITRDYSVLYRPGEEPINGVCPVKGCGIAMISLKKAQRHIHIHNCRHIESASAIARRPSELNYCFVCFDWFVEEKWNEHCLLHLESITSRRCGPLKYCNTLVYPGLCPFCLGDDNLPASSRWRSWTREEKLRSHLKSHIAATRWPFICPHPLCVLLLNDIRSFIYHLKDVHCLDIYRGKERWQQEECRTDPFVHYASDTMEPTRKRKNLDEGFHETKIRKMESSSPFFTVEHPNEFQYVSLHQLSKADDNELVLPNLSCDGSTPDLGELYQDEPEYRDSLEAKADICALLSYEDDNMFPQFLRSRSSSCLSEKRIGNTESEYINLPTSSSNNLSLFKKDSQPLVNISGAKITRSPDNCSIAKKPRITLRVNAPKQPRISLRLSAPKQPALKALSLSRKRGHSRHK